ncbi:hypothetical protein TrVE_jg9451 [Triparma verrucosa]|uniref:EF-hand domain-containing protein n=1 Tax=Triparma verrucosa TaxID=1606542 RepID=A0A9W7CEJ4_9STRA|nr:hypothetical protein TrVE_jg9451 [Triparma verrucosa]
MSDALNDRQRIREGQRAKDIDAILGNITKLEVDEKNKGKSKGGGKQSPGPAHKTKRSIEEQVQRFSSSPTNKPKDMKEQKLLAQNASGANLPGISRAKGGRKNDFVSKGETEENYKRSGTRRRSFGSTREARRDSKMANSESLPFLVGDGAKKDENGGILKVTIDSGGSPKQSKRERRMRKTLDPGSVKFDVGFTVDEIKKSSTKREERRTAAKEKREAMLEAQREAVLGSIDKKEEKRKLFQKKKELQILQRKLLVQVVLASYSKAWIENSRGALEKWNEQKVFHAAARTIQRKWKKFIRALKLVNSLLIRQRLAHCEWRVIMWYKCTKRKMQAQLLRTFFTDFAVQQVAYIIYTFRYRVVRVQRMIKSFLACKKARKLVLEKMWLRMEKRVTDEESAFKKRKNSVIPALGEKLQSASKRFNIIENNMRKKNKNFQLDMLSGSRAEMQDIDSSAMNECTPKGVEIKTMRFLIRTHLEEQRMMHTERAAAILLEQQSAPTVTEDHAKQLLAGTLLHVEAQVNRVWPVFSLFKGGKQRFFDQIEEAIRDKETVENRVRERKDMEYQMLLANRYEMIEEGDEEESEEGEEGEGSGEESEDEAMTLEEEQAQNQELAVKFETTAKEVQEFREMFQLVDLDHGGSIDAGEFSQLLSLLGMEKSEEEIQEMVDKIDTTGEHEVFFPDFVRALKSDRPEPSYTEAMVLSSFEFFSRVDPRSSPLKSGTILKTQLSKGLMSYKGKWNLEQAENALHDAGLNQMELDYSTYVSIMFQLCKA